MKPIPKSLLPHSAALKSATIDAWQKPVDTPIAALEHVRVEPSSKIIKSKDNTEKQLAAVMFYDVRNSSPKNQAFAAGQVVVFDGARYEIELVDKLYDARHLHHLEIGMSGGG